MADEQDFHQRSIEILIGQYGKNMDDERIKEIYAKIQSHYMDVAIRQYLHIIIRREAEMVIQQTIID